MKGCPCRGCLERHEACHDTCEKYRTWKKPLLDLYEERLIPRRDLSPAKEAYLRRAMNERKRRGH